MAKGRRPISLLLIVFFLISFIHAHVSAATANYDHPEAEAEPKEAEPEAAATEEEANEDDDHVDDSMRYELIHRHSLEVGSQKTPQQRMQELIAKDMARHTHPARPTPRRRDWEKQQLTTTVDNDLGIPINSAAELGTAEYVVSFKVGTPVQRFLLVADTGSSLTWIKCKYNQTAPAAHNNKIAKIKKPAPENRRRIFRAYKSETFRTIPCSSNMCRNDFFSLFSIIRCPVPKAPCAYDYAYTGGDSAFGFFANETVSVGHKKRGKRLENILIGCSLSYRGKTFGETDGVLGLGFHNYSFAMQAANEIGGKFSYCLVDHLSPKNVTGYLFFGKNKEVKKQKKKMQLTGLVLGELDSHYAVNIKGLSFGGKLLDIPPMVWDYSQKGGAILDSGTSITFLSIPAYEPVMQFLMGHVSKYPRVKLPGLDQFEYCFNGSEMDEALVPRLAIHFTDGAVFSPSVSSYLLDVDGPFKSTRCIGFMPSPWPSFSIIGNIMQQNHLWEFNLVDQTLGFAPSTCR